MAKLAGKTIATFVQLAIYNNSQTNSPIEMNNQYVPFRTSQAKPQFGKSAGLRIVFDQNFQSEFFLKNFSQRTVGYHVGFVYSGFGIDHAGHFNTNPKYFVAGNLVFANNIFGKFNNRINNGKPMRNGK